MKHSFSPAAFVLGLLLTLVASVWLLRDNDVLSADQLGVAGPVALIVIGVLGIVLTLRRRS